jgi:ankyrin repeat protein
MRCYLLAVLCSASCLVAGDLRNDLRLIDAVKDQDRKAIDSLIGSTDVNVAQPDGATPLAWAVYLDQADIADRLLNAGAKVNTADEYGDTPLTLACTTGNSAIIEKLIAAGADVTVARWNGETALMLAARSGSVSGVKALIAHGAKVDVVESHKGQNALMWAAAEGHSDVVALLIQNGADVKMASKAGFTPIVFAAQKGDAKSVAGLLHAGADVNYTVPTGTALLEIAALSGKSNVVDVLLNSGATVDGADKAGNTALHVAAQSGDLDTVKLLLAKGASSNVKNAKAASGGSRTGGGFFRPTGEQTPLLLAAKANHEDVMRALVAGGADPKLKAQDGTTLLMSAAGSGHVEVVRYAFELDPDVNAVTDTGRTVMHSSVFGSMTNSTQPEVVKVVQFLADKGAALDASDSTGRTPIMIADLLPIDKAVDLLTKLIKQSGKVPKQATRR